MQGGRGGRHPFFDFGDPFGGFGGFGGFGRPGSMISSFFGGRDPFDDPFFTRPFGGTFESNFFGSGSPFGDMHPAGFIEDQPPEPKRSRGPIIEEIDSDDEKEEADKEKKENPRKHSRLSNEPYVEYPNGEVEGWNRQLQHRTDPRRSYYAQQQPQTHSFSFQSSTVTHGGANGTYYTSSKTRRTGSDGITFEELKEADTGTRQATHQVSRGLHNKGHLVTRKLDSDGRVNTMQTLHNMNEDELTGFEEAWNGNAKKYLPGYSGSGFDTSGVGSSGQNVQSGQGRWALPSTEHLQQPRRAMPNARDRAGPAQPQRFGRMKLSSDARDKSAHSRGKQRD